MYIIWLLLLERFISIRNRLLVKLNNDKRRLTMKKIIKKDIAMFFYDIITL